MAAGIVYVLINEPMHGYSRASAKASVVLPLRHVSQASFVVKSIGTGGGHNVRYGTLARCCPLATHVRCQACT